MMNPIVPFLNHLCTNSPETCPFLPNALIFKFWEFEMWIWEYNELGFAIVNAAWVDFVRMYSSQDRHEVINQLVIALNDGVVLHNLDTATISNNWQVMVTEGFTYTLPEQEA